jgi:hypothetical protein
MTQTALQKKVAAERAASAPVVRAAANRAKKGITSTSGLGLDSSIYTSNSAIASGQAAVMAAAISRADPVPRVTNSSGIGGDNPIAIIPGITPGIDTSIMGGIIGGTTMASAGQDLTLYQQIDSALGGYLPGGTAPGSSDINPLIATGAKVLGASAVAAGAIAGGIAIYNWYKKDGTPRKLKANGQPYKKPSMNYANPKAISRATRRLTSFKNHYAKSVRVLGYHVSRGGK